MKHATFIQFVGDRRYQVSVRQDSAGIHVTSARLIIYGRNGQQWSRYTKHPATLARIERANGYMDNVAKALGI